MTFLELVQRTAYSGDHLQGPYRSVNLPHTLKMQRQEHHFHKWFQAVHDSVAVFSESSITDNNTRKSTQLYVTFKEKQVSHVV